MKKSDNLSKGNAADNRAMNERKLLSMIENGRDIITLLDATGNVTFRSRSYINILGYDPGQMTGHGTFDSVHPNDLDKMKAAFRELMSAPGTSTQLRWRQKHIDGSYKWMEGTSINLLNDPDVNAIVCNSRDITPYINAEAELQKKNKELSKLFNSIDEVLYTVDVNTYTLTQMSDACLKVYGYPTSDFFENPNLWNEAILPEDRHIPFSIGEALAEGTISSCQYRIKHKDGSIRWLEACLTPTLDETGKLVRMDGVNRDVTEKKVAEQSLLDSEKRYRTLIENSKEGLVITDLAGKMLYITPSVKNILGYEPKEMIGQEYLGWVHPDDLPENLASIKAMVSEERPFLNTLIRMRHKKGHWIWIESTISNQMDDPTIGALVTNFRDVSQRIKAEEAALNNEQRFRALIENSKDVIALTDADRVITYMSPSVKDILGYEAEELIGKRSYDILMNPNEVDENISFRESIPSGQTASRIIKALHKDGSWRWIEGEVTNHLDNPAVAGILTNFRDVTAKVNAEQALVHSERRFRALIENHKDGVALTNRDRRFTYISPQILHIYGYESEALLGMDPLELYHPDDIPRIISFVQSITEKYTPYSIDDMRILHRDGTWRWAELTFADEFDDPAINALVCNFRDTTEKKAAAEALANSEIRFRSLIENNMDGIGLSDRNSNFIYFSPSVKKILGFDPEEMVGTNAFSHYHPDDLQEMKALAMSIREQRGAHATTTIRLMHKDGDWRWIELTATNQLDTPGVNAVVTNFRDVTERKVTAEALAYSEKRFRALIENNKEGIALSDRSRHFTYMSPSIKSILGYEPEEIIGMKAYEMYHEDDQQNMRELVEAISSGRQSHAATIVRVKHKNGEWKWIELTASNQFDDPAVNAMVTNFHDVTEKRKTEEALHKSERKFRAVIENNKDGIALSDADRTLLYLSPSIRDILGYEPAELIGTKSYDLVHPDDVPQNRTVLATLISGEKPDVSSLMRMRHKDGSWRWIEVTVSNQLDDQALQAIVTNFRDVTHRINSEEQIRNSEKKFRTLIENSHDGIALLDADLKLTYLSPSIKNILGYDAEELLSGDTLWLSHPDDVSQVAERFASVLYGQKEHVTMLVRSEHKDGSWRWIESLVYNQLENPAVNAIVSNFRDVTESKRAAEELEQLNQSLERKVEMRTEQLVESNKALESFSYMAAHDLQAPLRVLAGYAAILKQEYRDDLGDDGQGLLDTIVKKTKHMSQLVSDLLTFSRASHMMLKEEPVNFDQLVRDIADQLSLSALCPVTPEIVIHDLGSYTCDVSLMSQVWVNLISNALKYSSKRDKSKIEIGSNPADDEMVFYIKDNGAGFDPRYTTTLFEVFRRFHSSSDFEGTGVGLALVKQVVTRHGGKVWAESEVDKGATFFFALPASGVVRTII